MKEVAWHSKAWSKGCVGRFSQKVAMFVSVSVIPSWKPLFTVDRRLLVELSSANVVYLEGFFLQEGFDDYH